LCFPRIVLDRYLISVALNGRHLTEGQKAVLANNYSKILSKKLNENKNSNQPRDEKGRFLPLGDTVSTNGNEEKDRSRKIAAERWKVSEWKVRIAQEIEKKAINVRWHPEKKYDGETVSPSYEDEVAR